MGKLDKIKQYGFKGCIEVLYKYKLQEAFRAVFSIVFKVCKIKDVILIESMNDFDMNGGALYDYLIEHDYNKKYKIVWLVKNKTDKILPSNVVALPIEGMNVKREYYNNVARFIFYDNHPIYKMKKEQIVVYCGHATRAMKDCRGLVTQPTNIDYVLSASAFNDGLMCEVYGCTEDKMLEVGMPCTDVLFRDCGEILDFGAENDKVIVWMPTFRKSNQSTWRNDTEKSTQTGMPLVETFDDVKKLDCVLAKYNVKLVIKFHPAQDMKEIHMADSENIMLLSADKIKQMGIDTYQLLTQTDAMISDYSSISFDYLLLDKPLAYVLSDYEEYKLGFAVDNPKDYMPGEYIYTIDEMYKFIEAVGSGEDKYKEKRNELKSKIHTHHDGRSCERLVEFLKL